MEIVTISPEYQVAIPKTIRKSLKLQPGQKMQVILYNSRIELILLKPIPEMRGLIAGIDTTIEREADRL